MGNWSGKRKPKSKTKRKAKVEKRLERKVEADRTSDNPDEQESSEASTLSDSGPEKTKSKRTNTGVVASSATFQSKAIEFLAGLRSKWEDLPPHIRIATLFGVVIIAGVGLYQYIETRPTGPVRDGGAPFAAPAATTVPPVDVTGLPGMDGDAAVRLPIPAPVPSDSRDASPEASKTSPETTQPLGRPPPPPPPPPRTPLPPPPRPTATQPVDNPY